MQEFDKLFNDTLASRNEEQREAIQTIEGPVMVVAGPGTGKTDVLGLRAGYILKETDTQPHNILCLTYTDAGAVSMRQRLKRYIGAAAYQVPIYTFHGFCNDVIQHNIQEFGGYRDLQPMDDLERVKMLRKMIDEIPYGHELYRVAGSNKYFDVRRLTNLFSLMKSENWSTDYVLKQIDTYLANLGSQKGMGYARTNLKKNQIEGELTAAGLKKQKTLLQTRAAAELYERYLELSKQRNRYDYADMILWVIDAFKNSELLLLEYQERYQYIMVDEFQDTNGAQLELVDLIASYWDRPNLFVVGDDDQAIYRFQGADMSNIKKFQEKYSPQEVVLKNNYRSSDRIVELSSHLIKKNKERLKPNKELIAAGPHKDAPDNVTVQEYESVVQENAAVTQQIIELFNTGQISSAESVAIIYKKHAQGEQLLSALQAEGVPVELKRKSDVILDPLGKQIITILRYLSLELKSPYSGEYLLMQMLFYRCFDLSAGDVIRLQRESLRRRKAEEPAYLYDVLRDETWIHTSPFDNKENVLRLGRNIQTWRERHAESTFQVFLERILSYGNIIEYILNDPERSWKLRVVHTIMEYIKEQSAKDHKYSIHDFIVEIDERLDHGIALPIQRILRAGAGVQLMTAHSSKGLEFDHVFMIHATKNGWKKSGGGNQNFSKPDTLNTIRDNEGEEDDRRLFYVAMTRARKKLTISYHVSDSGKAHEESSFVTEISECSRITREEPEVDEAFAYKFITEAWDRWPVDQGIFDHELIKDTLERFSLSVTALNKYLRCPTAFYFENILRVPFARNVHMGFGQAIHYALERWVSLGNYTDIESLLKFFNLGMLKFRSHFTDQEFDERTQYGREILLAYFTEYSSKMLDSKHYQVEVDISNVQHKGVPITGKLDLVASLSQDIHVTDYKTGDAKNSSKKLKPPKDDEDLGGDYWRQIVYYKILLESDPRYTKAMSAGYMNYVQPDKKTGKFTLAKIVPSPSEVQIVSDQIVNVYERIMKHEFEPGCQEPDCTWCTLINNNMRVKEPLSVDNLDEHTG